MSPSSPNSCNPSTRDPRRARFPRRSCYSDRTLPKSYCARVSPSSAKACNSGFPSHASRGARATMIARVPKHPCYSLRTRPKAYCATVSPSSANSCNPGFPSHAFRGAYATVIARFPRRTVLQCRLPTPARATRHSGIPVARFPMHPCYSDRTHPEAPPCYIDRAHPEAYCATVSA